MEQIKSKWNEPDREVLKVALFKRVPLTMQQRKNILASGRIITSGLTRNYFCEVLELDVSLNTEKKLAGTIFNVWGEGVYYALRWRRRKFKNSKGEIETRAEYAKGKIFEVRIVEKENGRMDYYFIDRKRISKYKFWKGNDMLNKRRAFF